MDLLYIGPETEDKIFSVFSVFAKLSRFPMIPFAGCRGDQKNDGVSQK
jgi:hypothetical protein